MDLPLKQSGLFTTYDFDKIELNTKYKLDTALFSEKTWNPENNILMKNFVEENYYHIYIESNGTLIKSVWFTEREAGHFCHKCGLKTMQINDHLNHIEFCKND